MRCLFISMILAALTASARPARADEKSLVVPPDEKTSARTPGSCKLSDMVCADYDTSLREGARSQCQKYKLTWQDKPCPKEKIVGTCVRTEGKGKSYTHSYPPATVETARKACQNTPGGAFVE